MEPATDREIAEMAGAPTGTTAPAAGPTAPALLAGAVRGRSTSPTPAARPGVRGRAKKPRLDGEESDSSDGSAVEPDISSFPQAKLPRKGKASGLTGQTKTAVVALVQYITAKKRGTGPWAAALAGKQPTAVVADFFDIKASVVRKVVTEWGEKQRNGGAAGGGAGAGAAASARKPAAEGGERVIGRPPKLNEEVCDFIREEMRRSNNTTSTKALVDMVATRYGVQVTTRTMRDTLTRRLGVATERKGRPKAAVVPAPAISAPAAGLPTPSSGADSPKRRTIKR